MHFYQNERVALFIDGANLYATSKALGFDIDYKRLLTHFRGKSHLVSAFYYTALAEDQEYSSIRPLIDWLDYNGYTMVTKPTREFTDASGRRKSQGQHGHRACGGRHASGRQPRPHRPFLRRRRFPFAGRMLCSSAASASAWCPPSRRSSPWSPMNSGASPISLSTWRIWKLSSVAIREHARHANRARIPRAARPPLKPPAGIYAPPASFQDYDVSEEEV